MDLWWRVIIFCMWKKKMGFLYIYENTVYFTEINLVKFQEKWILMCTVSFIEWVCNSYTHTESL